MVKLQSPKKVVKREFDSIRKVYASEKPVTPVMRENLCNLIKKNTKMFQGNRNEVQHCKVNLNKLLNVEQDPVEQTAFDLKPDDF